VDELVELNGIDNPDLIYPGNEIIVKAGSSRDDDCDVVYQVRPGDTLSEIAARYNTTVDELVELNGIDNPDLIYPDTILKIK
uniref:LysM peptidoglycan-binding domain-containing protein n=1 Tax=Lachnospira eligens TaxID=39485 RepID=UPI0040284CA8